MDKGVAEETLSMLDIAPSPMLMERLRKKYLHIGVDIQQFSKQIIPMNITRLEFPADYFDRVLCSHVLEHVRNDELALQEIFRVTAPGGVFLCQVPFSDKVDTTPLTEPDKHGHVWNYGGQDFLQRILRAGFVAERIHHGKSEPEMGFDSLDMFVARKPGTPEPRDFALLKWASQMFSDNSRKDFARKPIAT